ncbi:uncharacterized protein LOC113345454 [Papaver somniferum]|uniref:uncharacterized protein LOC113345454 n=1 Tax=Papaver somniferum TaxID=3469 RepID=UPI000E6F789C|nr:uncharacterized protein LOC113345454 [Papaver somniferum]
MSQRIKLFIWKCMNSVLPMNQILSCYMPDVDENCIFCHDHIETLEHLLFECVYAKSVWNLPPFSGGVNKNTMLLSSKEHYNQWQVGGDISTETSATKCWFIWKERCNRVFEAKATSSLQLSIINQRHVNYWSTTQGNMDQQTSCTNSVAQQSVPWKLPDSKCDKINYDASWVSHVNNASYGLIMRNDAGDGKAGKSRIIEASSPEKAEALALLQGARGPKMKTCLVSGWRIAVKDR